MDAKLDPFNSTSSLSSKTNPTVMPEVSPEICYKLQMSSHFNISVEDKILIGICAQYMSRLNASTYSFFKFFDLLKVYCIHPVFLILAVFGAVTNAINIIVFYHQGLMTDNSTPIFVGLSVSDFLLCILMVVKNVLQIISSSPLKTSNPQLAGNIGTIQIITTPSSIFVQFSCWVTTYLAFERMVSVTFPFRVKTLFNPKRSYVIIGTIFAIICILQLPQMVWLRLTIKVTQNGTVVLGTYPSNILPVSWLRFAVHVNYTATRFITIALVIIFNVVIITKVNLSKQFHKSSTKSRYNERGINSTDASKSAKPNTNKEGKLTRMIVTLSIVFVVCYLPTVMEIFIGSLNYIKLPGAYYDMVYIQICYYLNPMLEFINSSINFIVYYTLSSKFKKELRKVCFSQKPPT